jgi:hypothetical protein
MYILQVIQGYCVERIYYLHFPLQINTGLNLHTGYVENLDPYLVNFKGF